MKFEILAPAGSQEALVAGVRCGANAVYLGGKSFNARRNAGNFDDAALAAAVKYCHERNVKVYLTLNTLCSDAEMQSAYDLVKSALLCGTDAFIIQDIGVAQMVRECFPQAKLHASTQMSVMNPAGLRKLKEMGFCRAVLPREMSESEILEMRKSTDMQLEMFIHGALCMSVSGQCYLSSMIGARSGNRGLCAQPCRLPFSADKSGSCDLSLKDLSLVRRLAAIEKAGVLSLKIEGRMKRPEYVAAAVTAVKSAINGSFDEKDESDLRSVFSRSGFTSGYFDGKLGKSMFGTRQKEDVVSAAGVLKRLSHLYDNENPLVPVDFRLEFKENKPVALFGSALGKSACAKGAVPEKAINKPLNAEMLKSRLSKLGGTQFYVNETDVDCDDGLILPAAQINELRRRVIDKLSEADEISVCENPLVMPPKVNKSGVKYMTARFANAKSVPREHPFKRVFIPIWSDNEDFKRLCAGVEIPRGMFGMEEKTRQRLLQLKKIGVNQALCGNLGSYQLASELGLEPFGDFGLNIFNSLSANQINSPILSFELTVDMANAVNAFETGVLVYGRLPLMLARNCPVKNNIGCAECGKKGKLTDRKGVEFPVRCSPYPCVEVLNSVPLYMADRMKEVKSDFAHFYFTDESLQQVEKIIALYQSGSKAPFDYTRGLYYRGVL